MVSRVRVPPGSPIFMDFIILFFVILSCFPVILYLIVSIAGALFGGKRMSAGERGEVALYRKLVGTLNVPAEQILRNVYVPTGDGGTSEIDLLIVSRKGIFVFECKNYGGNIYGDAKFKNWLQYIGREKHTFYNPLLQNRTHCKNLRAYLYKKQLIGSGFPIISLISTTNRGAWKIRNLSPKDYILGINGHFIDIYNSMPEQPTINSAVIHNILNELTRLTNPSEETIGKHIIKATEMQNRHHA